MKSKLTIPILVVFNFLLIANIANAQEFKQINNNLYQLNVVQMSGNDILNLITENSNYKISYAGQKPIEMNTLQTLDISGSIEDILNTVLNNSGGGINKIGYIIKYNQIILQFPSDKDTEKNITSTNNTTTQNLQSTDDDTLNTEIKNKELDEVVVIGYGVQKKRDITGAVSSIKPSELTSAPNSNVSQALQGRVAGVSVQNNSGNPSGDVSIRIRGSNSLNYGNDPLVIIDGIQGADLGSLNPNQIESMEILKDAAALSVYGARGANGVILVTTKMGKSAKPQITYNGFVSFDQVSKKLPVLNATQFANQLNTARIANNLSPMFTSDQIAGFGKGTNWQDAIFRNAVSTTNNISINGSKGTTSYYIATGVVYKQGIITNSNFQQYTLRANIKTNVTKRLSFTFNSFFAYNVSNSGEYSQALLSALQWAPTKPIYDNTIPGGYSQPGGGAGPNDLYNPVGYAKEIVDHNTAGILNLALTGEYKFTDYLKFSSLVAYKLNSNVLGNFDNQVANNGPASNVYGQKTLSRYMSLQNTNILSFDKTFSGHNIQATVVYELFTDNMDKLWTGAKGIPIGLGYNGIQYGTAIMLPYSTYSNTSLMSFMGRVNYAYKNKYLASASLRYDGASQLAPGNKFNNFYAFSVGWNLMEEKFMQSIKHILSEFKIRGSYGIVGNSAVPAYASQMLFDAGLDANNNPTLMVSQLGNKNLRWEKTREWNGGIDVSFLQGRIFFSAEYYDKKTTDLLMFKKVPTVMGGDGTLLSNVGSVSNRGIDIVVGGTPVVTKNFSWKINYVFNNNRNRILELDGLSDILIYESNADYPGLTGSFVQMKGQPMGTFLGYKYIGVWQTDEAFEAKQYGRIPGDAKYEDINHDGVIDDKDIGVIGSAQPKMTFGFNNTFTYKNLELNIFFQGVWGNQIYNQNRIRMQSYEATTTLSPTSTAVLNVWTPNNPSNIPSITGFEYINSSRWVEDGSYFRLKSITLSYRFPDRWMSRAKIALLRLYVTAYNLFTITKYTGFDPEASMGTDATAAGIDRGIYPSARSFLIGVDITF